MKQKKRIGISKSIDGDKQKWDKKKTHRVHYNREKRSEDMRYKRWKKEREEREEESGIDVREIENR